MVKEFKKSFKYTPKHRRFVKAYFETGSIASASRTAGISADYGSELLKHNPRIASEIEKLQVKGGLTDELLERTHVELLIQKDDNNVRLGATRLGYQLKKKIGSDEPPITGSPGLVIIRDSDGTGKITGIQTNTKTDISIRRADGS